METRPGPGNSVLSVAVLMERTAEPCFTINLAKG